ncbi:MAG: sugar ABC transporter permease [Clostridiales bacterium]|nr:sugar ABC transporter permease [Clostridiales bacterium]
MPKRITWRQFLFVLPLLLLVSVFSLYPIFTSGVYSFFDYQTNDQTRNALYTEGHLNAPLFHEDGTYLNFYLKKDLSLVDETGQQTIAALQQDILEAISPYAEAKQPLALSGEGAKQVTAFVANIRQRVKDLENAYPDVELNISKSADSLLDEMDSTVVGSNFIGLEGYKRLGQDGRFFSALRNTLVFTIISVFFELLIGMGLALVMNRAVRGIGLVRTVSLIPWAIPTAVSALIWTYLYDGTSGIVARLFTQLGLIASPELLLTSASGTMAAAIIADVWKTTPYMALLLLAGLQVIDHGLYESASVDGAGPVRTFIRITLPLLKPSLLVALLFRTLDAFRVYDLIAVLTKGTPETLSIYAYKVMVGQGNYGYGAVIVLAMFVCVGLIALLYVKVLGAELINE